MTDSSSHSPYRVVPRDEIRCVWMTAGILTYQLCDRNCDCDLCPLDAAMRRHFAPPRTAPTELKKQGTEQLRENHLYSPNHCWIHQERESVMRIGIEPSLAGILLVPKAVVLPVTGRNLKRGQVCVWIVMEDGTLPVAAPCDGKVVTRNAVVSDEPQQLYLEPFEQGWLFEIEPGNAALSVARLLEKDDAESVYSNDAARFTQEILSALHEHQPDIGATLADGGVPLQHFSDVLGSKRYFSIVRSVFGSL